MDESSVREELAACYRIFDRLGWSELIYNHITARIPGTEHLLINPYGLHYREVTPGNLVKIDLAGNVLDGAHPINPAGLVIHSAIHGARPDAGCVAHTHTTAGLAVACQRGGLRTDNFYSTILAGCVAYHDFEGITVRDDEKPRLVANLGQRDALILRNHGLLAIGRTIAGAFAMMWTLQRACEIQVATDACGGDVIPLSADVSAASAKAISTMRVGSEYGELEFRAMVRLLERDEPRWREGR